MKSLRSVATRHPVASLILSLAVAMFFLAFIPRIQTIDNVDYFTVDGDPDFAFHKEIKEIFGDDEFFVISFKQPDIFTENNLLLLRELAEKLEAHPGVRDVQSLGNVDYVDGAQEYFEVRKFLEVVPDTQEGLDLLRHQALTTPMYLDNLISRDGGTTALIVYPYDRPEDKGFRADLLGDVRGLLSEYESEELVFHLAGNTVTNVSLSRYVQDDVAAFIPLTYFFVALVIWIMFRNVRLTVLALINISVCVGSTMGFMALIGTAMHNVTSVIPSLVMALALADTVHIFSCLDRKVLRAAPDTRAALAHILEKVFVPCFLTTLTTAVGFLSLAVSSIPPIREFAYVASMGMIFEFFFSFVLLPPLLLLCNPSKIYRETAEDKGMNAFLHFLKRVVTTHNVKICVAGLVLVLVSIWFSGRVQVETNLVEYFDRKSELRQDLDFIQNNLSGVSTLDISIKSDTFDAFTDPENLAVIDEIQAFLHTLPGVDTSISFADYIKEMNKSFHDEDSAYYVIPGQRDLIAQYLLLYDSENIDDYVNNAFDHARILVRLSENSSARQAQLIDRINEFLEDLPQDDLKMRITGSVVQQVNVIEAVTDGLVSSIALALVVITVIMFVVLRSVKVGFLSLVPNLFPLILNFGIMGLLGIPLDTSTALIAVVALGIAVDDTIHFLSEYNFFRQQKMSMVDSLESVLLGKGLAIVTTSVILCAGFGVLVFSNFVPTFYFGLLSAMVMLTALVGDMLLLPSIMLLRKKAD
jgi:predicted RND superfamily exporter protein